MIKIMFRMSQKRKKLILYIILIFITLAVYWQVNQFDFISLDDSRYVTQNIHIQSGITKDTIRWTFTGTDKLWTPLLWLSFMLDYRLYGLNAGGYHVTNLIFHILSTLLLFWLFHRMTGELWKSAFVAAFFALHPLHVESVVWVSERKDVLSAFFWMATLCLYVFYTEKPAVRRYLLVLCAFVLALMSKPMVVTLPVIMILLDYWPLKRFESRKDNLFLWQLKEKLPFFILSAILSFVTFYDSLKIDNGEHFPFASRFANAIVALVKYLARTFWPHDLAAFYPFPSQIPLWQVLVAAFLIIAIAVATIVMVKRLPYLFVGWMWFAITIFPVTGIMYPIWLYAMADRYHYLPSIGLSVMMAWGVPNLFPNDKMRKKILFPTAIIFLILMSATTWKQCGYWKNSITLWTHASRVIKNNYLAYSRLGNAYGEMKQYPRAIYYFNEVLRIRPNYEIAFNGKGLCYNAMGMPLMAVDEFNKALHFKPDYAAAYNNRALSYFMLGDTISGCADAKKACALGECKIWNSPKSDKLCR